MEVPSEIIVFGRAYTVSDVSSVQCSEGVLGQAAYRDGVIYLDHGLDPSLTLSTLWHEAVHIAQQEILGTIDEAQARWIALFAHNFLMDNPQIMESYLQELNSGTSGGDR
jgi:hypothetical protein